MSRTYEKERVVLLSGLLILSMIAGSVAGGGLAVEADNSQYQNLRIDETPKQLERPDPEQTAVVSPGAESSFVAGGIYTALVSVNVSTLGALESITTSNKISSPKLSVSVSTSAPAEKATLVGIATEGEGGYTAPSSDSFPDDNLTLDSSSAFTAGTQRTVVVRFKIDSDDPPEELTLSVDPTPQESNGDKTAVSYEVTQSVTQSAAMARTAGARAQLAAGYLESYNTLLKQEPWNNRFKRSMSEAFTIVANDATQSLVTGYTDEALAGLTSVKNTNNLASVQNAQTAYGMSQNKYGSSTVGRIAQLNEELYNDLNDRIATDTVQRQGNASYALRELQSLSKQEQTAWQNGNRERVRSTLYKKQYVLTGTTSNPQQIESYIQDDPAYPQSFDNRFDPRDSEQFAPDDPSLRVQAESLQKAAEDEGKPKLQGYFTGLKKFSTSQAEYIEQTALPLARDPAPSVTVSPSRNTLQSQLSNLQADQSVTATFEIENNGGVTSSQGYLSVSTAQGLNVTGFEQISGDDEVAVTNYSVGEEISKKGATEKTPASYPLTDIREQYDSGETNTYKLTITNESQSAGPAWITYRTAFEPLIHADNETTFSRYPKETQSKGTDQQNFAAFNVSAEPDDTNQPPIAQITNSQTSAQLETTVSVSGAQSTDDGGISSYEWRVYNATSGTQLSGPQSGQEASFSFASPGSKNVTLLVTDSRGQTDTASQILTVEPKPSVSPSFDVNRTFIEPDSATQLRATTTAESYAWDLDEDGNYDDASGPTTVWTPATSGSAEIGLQVTTADGRQGTVRLTYTVENATEQLTAPTPVIDGPSTASVGETVTLDASNSTDQTVSEGELVSGSIEVYEWDFDSDGSIDATGVSVSTSFTNADSYVVTLTVTDTDGYTSSTQLPITVNQTNSSGGFVDLSASDLPGDGSESDPYEISNVSELQAMEDDLSANYELVSDIDASVTAQANDGRGFAPIGGFPDGFSGSFDGQGNSIEDLTIKRPNKDDVGLFGYTSGGAVIEEVILTNDTVTGSEDVGGLVGESTGGTVSNSSASGVVNGTGEFGFVGGLVGENTGATVSNSSASGVVTGFEDVGGLVGYNEGTVSNSSASATVTGSGDGPYVGGDFGGLVGYNELGGTVSNSSASGAVTGSSRVGGLVGFNSEGTVSESFATGAVTGSSDVGGLVGLLGNSLLDPEEEAILRNSYYDTQTTEQQAAVGKIIEEIIEVDGTAELRGEVAGLPTSQIQGASAAQNMGALDFQTTWTTTDGYPTLRAFSNTNESDGGDDPIPTASVTFENQTVLTGTQNVTVESAQFVNKSVPGEEFVIVVHETTDGRYGSEIGPKVGESAVLSAGTHTDITVDLNTTLGASDSLVELTSSQSLVAMLHRANTTDGDEITHGSQITRNGDTVTSRAQITVTPPPLPGYESAPQDPDRDGFFEDVNGDGEQNILDVQGLFNLLEDEQTQQNAGAFSFQSGGSDELTVLDVQALFNELPE